MDIGILKEDELYEHRVALSPVGVQTLASQGHAVYVQQRAGALALFTDEEYRQAGATIAYSPEEIINRSDVVLKISPPTRSEIAYFRKGQVLFSFLHVPALQKLMTEMLEGRMTAVSYELVENNRGELSILQVMGEIAGQLSLQAAAYYLQARQNGRGILLGSIPGVPPASVVILGAGSVGRTATRVALGMGAMVTVLDNDLSRLRDLESLFQWRISTAIATPANIEKGVRHADALIGAVLMKGQKAPHLVTEAMVRAMKVGSVIIDVSIDEGGCVETSRPTRLDEPIFVKHGVIHYCVPNMPSSVARTSTVALTNALLPYILEVAEKGMDEAVRLNPGLAKGVCVFEGQCTNPAIARALNLRSKDLQTIILASQKVMQQ